MEAAVARWREAGEAGDADAAAACLHPEVEFVSPLTDRFRFRGVPQVHDLLRVVHRVVDDLRCTTTTTADASGDLHVLVFTGRVGGVDLEEAQFLRVQDGLLREITLFVRPVPAATALMRALGPPLARSGGRRGLARALGLATGVLHGMASSGDRTLVVRAAPR